MRQTEPQSAATWMLEHLTPGPRNEALVGDLLEEFRERRSAAWYWRQVLSAIAVGCSREILNHRTVLLFAAVWSMLAPAWLLLLARMEEHFNFSARIWRMDWPWSTVCDLGSMLAANLFFIWAGIFLYLLPHLWATKNLRVRPLSRGILASLPVLLVVWVALIVLPKIFLQGQVVDQHSVPPVSTYSSRQLAQVEIQQVSPQQQWDVRYGDKVIDPYNDPRNAIADMRTAALAVRLPFFLTVLCTLWGFASRRRNRIAA